MIGLMDYQKKSIEEHKKMRGKISVESKFPINNKEELSIAYTPGVAGPSLKIAENSLAAYDLTSMKNAVAVVSDGSAVLGLGNIGPVAALPVMEGKCALFKRFAGLDAVPIVLGTQNSDEIIATVKAIAPTFGGINLEDISAPRCFEIEKALVESLGIPVMHDDQHGTAIVILAGLINALSLVRKDKGEARVIISGAGAAGIATAKLLFRYGFKDLLLVDSVGIISEDRENLTPIKKEVLQFTNKKRIGGDLKNALKKADVFIGVSKANLLSKEDVALMNEGAIVFAMANPNPEIMPEDAKRGGAFITATGRSDYPNQINNVLAYPGIFKGAIEGRISQITEPAKIAAAEALASIVQSPTPEKIIPDPFDEGLAEMVAKAVRSTVYKN